jgi:hypothetical protein
MAGTASKQLEFFGPAKPEYHHLQVTHYFQGAASEGGEPRVTVFESRELTTLSGALNLLRQRLGFSFQEVDAVAVKACGRRWCDFTGVDDYKVTLGAL